MTDNVENTTTDAPQPSPIEQEARAGGWVPKEEYAGDENKWVDAAEFVRRGPLFDKINQQNKELKEIKKALEQFKVHHNTVKETAFKEALAALKAEKKAAFVEGDPDKIVEIDEKIDTVKEQQRQYEAQKDAEIAQNVQATVNPVFEAWQARNTWYNTSRPMRAFADALGIELHSNGLSPEEVLKRVEQQVKEEFPQKFRNPNRDKASPVESTGKGSGSKAAVEHLSDEERAIMKRFVRTGIMTEEQYIADLKKAKEI